MDANSIDDAVTMRPTAEESLGRIDQYELKSELGGGGFGCVYLANDTVAGIQVAVKGLPPLVRTNKEELENIRANFALVSRLHHPNIAAALVLHPSKNVSYREQDTAEKLRVFDGDTLVVMEYAPGITLSKWRKQFNRRRVPVEQALEIVRQIAAALDYAHAQNIIHRDVKPANVMIETKADGALVARVLDFGLAAEVRSSMGRISQEIHDTSGTRPYMAPEQWKGDKQGSATDQYALAALYFELITGEVPFQSVFESGDPVMMMATVINRKPVLSKQIPAHQRKIILRALEKDPRKRFPSCLSFVDALAGKSRGHSWVWIGLGLLLCTGATIFWAVPEQTPSKAEDAKDEKLSKTMETDAEENRTEEITTEQKILQEKRAYKEAEEKKEHLRKETEAKERQRQELERRAAEERARKEAEEKERLRKEAEEKERQRQEQARRAVEEARARARQEAEALFERLKKGSEFVPNPPMREAGTVRMIELPSGVKMFFVWCPPGRYLMGSPADEPERENGEIQHVVSLTKGFWMGQYEVTRKQWEVLMGRSRFRIWSLIGTDGDFPVDDITWNDCQDFCQRLGKHAGVKFRLPTEAEWEYACRAGTATPFSFGNSLNGDRACCAGSTEPYGTQESGSNSISSKRVGSYAQNPWGLYDMHGNVFEWCADLAGDYAPEAVENPKGPSSGSPRIVRGGCWNYTPKMCRAAFRSRKAPGSHDTATGFRVCCDELP